MRPSSMQTPLGHCVGCSWDESQSIWFNSVSLWRPQWICPLLLCAHGCIPPSHSQCASWTYSWQQIDPLLLFSSPFNHSRDFTANMVSPTSAHVVVLSTQLVGMECSCSMGLGMVNWLWLRSGGLVHVTWDFYLLHLFDSPFQAIKGMEWIEQLFFTDRPEGLLVSGFHSVSGVWVLLSKLMNWWL